MSDIKKTPEELEMEINRLEERIKGMESSLAQSFASFSVLQEREERYRLLVENLPDVAWTTDSAGHTVYASPQVEDICGFTSEEVIKGGDDIRFGRIHPDDRDSVRSAFERMLRGGGAFDLTYRIQHKNGSWVWLHDRAFARSTKEGTRYAHGIFQDITAHKEAEKDLLMKKAAVSSSLNAIAFGDEDGLITYVNASFLQQWGYDSEDEVVGRPATEFWRLPDEASAAIAGLHDQGGWSGELTARRKDGSQFMVQLTASMVRDESGKPLCLMVWFLNITERKKAENERAAAERMLRELIDAAPFGAHMYELREDNALVFIGANRAADRILGIPNAQFAGKTIEEAFPPLKNTGVPDAYRAVAAGGEMFEQEQLAYQDQHISGVFEVIATPLGKNRMATFFRDITERKKAEDALRREKNKTDAILAAVGDGISIQDRNYRVLYQNDAHKGIVGDHKGDFCYAAYQHRGDVCRECPIALAFRDGQVHTVERTVTSEKGTIYVEVTASPLRDADGTIIAGIEVVRNITQRRRAEEDRHRSHEQAQLLIDRMPVGCIMWDAGVRVALWNPMAETIFGYSAQEALGRHAHDLIVPEEAQAPLRAVWDRLLAGDQTAHSVSTNSTRDGRKIQCEWYNTPLHDAAGHMSFVLSMAMDVTDRQNAEHERRKLESQLLQSQKMEAIGLLAGGVAHDFNNILSAILGYASILQMKMPADDPLKPNVEQVLAASQRAATLTQSLLAFSRKQIINPQPLLVNESIRKIEKLLRRIIGEDIEFKTVYADPDMTILMDAGQLEQVIINLATNARDAMPRGGNMTLETCTTLIADNFIKQHGYGKSGTYTMILVSDTGSGMDEKTRERIFEPFFTTKELGKGTGLGLSTAYGIVKQNNGYLTCYSEPGIGTTFRVYLPIVADRGRQAPAAAPVPAGRGTETVLVAEDDQTMRDLFRSLLQDHGYSVLLAADGEEAVAQFRAAAGRVQLLVLDVVMPKKNGKEVFDEIRRVQPGIKALFTSGYTADILDRKGIEHEGLNFLSKPVLPSEFLKKVRDVLDGK
jgi:PAS domain S-box-containing protein